MLPFGYGISSKKERISCHFCFLVIVSIPTLANFWMLSFFAFLWTPHILWNLNLILRNNFLVLQKHDCHDLNIHFQTEQILLIRFLEQQLLWYNHNLASSWWWKTIFHQFFGVLGSKERKTIKLERLNTLENKLAPPEKI